ncbi:hypothetical protein [Ornithinibacillus halotolerans]|uniref:Uncharacterized protein n=1 Tax=Ornithinibacillus halotolerans TaxID=1274357 RepID=A0A916WET3_9BACI|nr:hypothetical protein [Ornithinibacillus halotolerans]GGA91520.1 hypothetical protein GCM10008025_37550 [Ornithinibacillus halotolerans]
MDENVIRKISSWLISLNDNEIEKVLKSLDSSSKEFSKYIIKNHPNINDGLQNLFKEVRSMLKENKYEEAIIDELTSKGIDIYFSKKVVNHLKKQLQPHFDASALRQVSFEKYSDIVDKIIMKMLVERYYSSPIKLSEELEGDIVKKEDIIKSYKVIMNILSVFFFKNLGFYELSNLCRDVFGFDQERSNYLINYLKQKEIFDKIESYFLFERINNLVQREISKAQD